MKKHIVVLVGILCAVPQIHALSKLKSLFKKADPASIRISANIKGENKKPTLEEDVALIGLLPQAVGCLALEYVSDELWAGAVPKQLIHLPIDHTISHDAGCYVVLIGFHGDVWLFNLDDKSKELVRIKTISMQGMVSPSRLESSLKNDELIVKGWNLNKLDGDSQHHRRLVFEETISLKDFVSKSYDKRPKYITSKVRGAVSQCFGFPGEPYLVCEALINGALLTTNYRPPNCSHMYGRNAGAWHVERPTQEQFYARCVAVAKPYEKLVSKAAQPKKEGASESKEEL
jgi:hypothetical protein